MAGLTDLGIADGWFYITEAEVISCDREKPFTLSLTLFSHLFYTLFSDSRGESPIIWVCMILQLPYPASQLSLS